ncbi:MAG: GGDEF domain-containing protein [Spirochaetales bacterium]|nr:GGDEF domain-containing protein [Spirochaetales bacterium]
MSQKSETIETWITPQPAAVEEGVTLAVAVASMAALKIGAILVTREGKLAGIFTERDLLKLFSGHDDTERASLLQRPVSQFMTPDPVFARKDEDYNTVYMKMKTHGVRHIPVLENDRLFGIVSMRDLIHFYQNKLEGAYNEARREIENLKRLVSVPDGEKIETLIQEVEKYKELSLTDHLTGLYNKRYFVGRLTEEVARAKRHRGVLSVIFCDIDYFKRINDRFGHHWGDEVLRETAQILSGAVTELHVMSRLRKSDIIARYGGEEFVAILPETGKEGAAVAAEKMRRSIADHTYQVSGEQVHITMSFGVAELSAEDPDPNEIIKNADYAMYKAKNSGRNRVGVYPEGSPQAP